MWKMTKIRESELEAIATALSQGYEPFAISTDAYGFCSIWFKKEEDEVFSEQPKSVKRTGRRAAVKF